MLIKKNKGPAVFQPMIGKVIGTQWIEVADGLAKKLLAANSGYSSKTTTEEPIVEPVMEEGTVERLIVEAVEEETDELEETVDEEDVSEDESFDDEDEFEEDEDYV